MAEQVAKIQHGSSLDGPGQRTWAAICVALFAAAFGPTMVELVGEWIDRPEYSHGFLMVPVALWLVKERWPTWNRENCAPGWGGIVLLVFGVVLLLLGEMKLTWFIKPIGLLFGLAGLIWAVWGRATLRHFGAVFVPLVLMYPLPGRVERALTVPLKQHAAFLSTGMLDLSGIPATLDGNIITLPGYGPMSVADACSGIRSLISLLSISVLACVFWDARIWVKALVLVAAVPIALFVNAIRIWATGAITFWISPEAAKGLVHDFEGLVMFAIAAAMLGLWAFLLQKISREVSVA
jgi:exosortase